MRIVIVGSGLLGVSTAWFLCRDGHEVTVLEREGDVARGTSFANSGMLTPSMADPWNAPGLHWHLLRWLGREDAPFLLRPRVLPSMIGWGLSFLAHSRPARFARAMEANLRLATFSLAVLRELRAGLSLRYDERAQGTIKVFRDARAFEHAVARNDTLRSLGLDVRVLAPPAIVVVEPALADVRDRLVGGLHCPDDESGDARAFTEQLAAHARAAGVRFVFDTEVTGFETDGAKLVAAHAGARRHAADAFVVAAGCWSAPLLARLGLGLPVRPVKGYSITVPFGAWASPPRMPVVDDYMHIAATPLGARLRVAGTAEIAGYDTSLPPGRIENLFDMALQLFPSLAPHLDRAGAAPWAGLRPVSADGVPRIGRLRFANLYVNAGQGHLGWTLAAGSARLLADLVAGRAPALDAAPYTPQRGAA
jgi:D-amino-acid dehydrogenase